MCFKVPIYESQVFFLILFPTKRFPLGFLCSMFHHKRENTISFHPSICMKRWKQNRRGKILEAQESTRMHPCQHASQRIPIPDLTNECWIASASRLTPASFLQIAFPELAKACKTQVYKNVAWCLRVDFKKGNEFNKELWIVLWWSYWPCFCFCFFPQSLLQGSHGGHM